MICLQDVIRFIYRWSIIHNGTNSWEQQLAAMPQSDYDIRFVAYYSLSPSFNAQQSRVSTTVANGIPMWRTPNSIELFDSQFVEFNMPTNFMDFVADNKRDSGICAGWIEIRRTTDQLVICSMVIEMIQTYTAGSNNVIVIRGRPLNGSLIDRR